MKVSKEDFVKKLFELGGHIGLGKMRRHPSAKPCVYATKHGMDIIDLEKTYEDLERAIEALKSVKPEDLLIVDSRVEHKAFVADLAESLSGNGASYVAGRWVGGTITNFPEIKKRIALLNDLTTKSQMGELKYTTKKEKLLLMRKLAKLEEKFGGLTKYAKTPKMLFAVSPRREKIAVKEARDKNIPIVGLGNTNTNFSIIDFGVCVPDNNLRAMEYIFNLIKEELS